SAGLRRGLGFPASRLAWGDGLAPSSTPSTIRPSTLRGVTRRELRLYLSNSAPKHARNGRNPHRPAPVARGRLGPKRVGDSRAQRGMTRAILRQGNPIFPPALRQSF